MYDVVIDDLGPIDYLVVEFPARKPTFGGPMATELASLVDAELIRVLDVVVIDKRPDGTYDVREFEDLSEADALGDLLALEGRLAEVLAVADLDQIAGVLEAGTTAAVVVWENSWAAPFAAAARRSGGELIATGRIATQDLVDALGAAAGTAGPQT